MNGHRISFNEQTKAEADMKLMTSWAIRHKDDIIAANTSSSKAFMSVHRMYCRHPDWPTYGMLMGVYDSLRAENPEWK